MTDTPKPVVQESAQYENFVGKKVEAPEPPTLSKFLDIPEDEDQDDVEWRKHWKEMPEFTQENNDCHKRIIVSFRNEEDYQEFAKLIEQNLSEKTKSIWYPKLDRDANSLKRWIEE